MSAGLMGWRPLARIAWRETSKRKGRTALVTALIALPVALLTVASIVVRSTQLSLSERRTLSLGPVADLRLSGGVGPDGAAVPLTLPTGARSVEVQQGSTIHRRGKSIDFLATYAADFSDPMLKGVFALWKGSWPKDDNATAISSKFARDAHLAIGDDFEVTALKRTLKVTGIFDKRDSLKMAALAFAPTAPFTNAGRVVYVDIGPRPTYDEIKNFLKAGRYAGDASGQSVWGTNDFDLLPGRFGEDGFASFAGGKNDNEVTPIAIVNVVGAIALFVLGIVVTAAFAVGARRQLRQLGLVAANGGDPRQLRRVVALQGTAAATVGIVAGFALGAVGVAAIAPHMNRLSGKVLPGISIAPFDVLLTAVLALIAGSIAAWLPGRTVARVPVLAALGGRRPLKNVRARVPLVGLIIGSFGLLLLFVTTGANGGAAEGYGAALGGVLVLLGGVITAPWLVGGLDVVAGRFEGSARLAARRLTRNRSRSGPIVAAIMATAAVSIAASAIARSAQQGSEDRYRPRIALDQVAVTSPWWPGADGQAQHVDPSLLNDTVEQTRALISGIVLGRYRVIGPYGGDVTVTMADSNPAESAQRLDVLIAGPQLLAKVGANSQLLEALANGSAILTNDTAHTGSTLRLTLSRQQVLPAGSPIPRSAPSPSETTISIPFVAAPPLQLGESFDNQQCDARGNRCRTTPSARLIISDVMATANGITGGAEVTLLKAPAALTKLQRGELGNLQSELFAAEQTQNIDGTPKPSPQLRFENHTKPPLTIIDLVLAGVTLLLALGVTGISLTLAAVDNRPDDAALAALGARPRTRRRVRACEAGMLTLLGMLLAIPVGFLPSIAIRTSRDNGDPIVFPWQLVGLLVIVVPLIATAIGWLSARSLRRVDTALLAD